MLLSCAASCMLCFDAFFQQRQASQFEIWRIMMHRWVVRTRTVTKKAVFTLLILSDVLSVLTALFCYPLFIEAINNYCESDIAYFLLIVGSYAIFAPIRLFIILAHFVYGQRFWRWVKRHVSCLNVVEYE